jgi:DNA segregation ATPase FtsK/SpoIIIE-like protein
VQGSFVSEAEVEAITDFLREHKVAQYSQEIQEQIEKEAERLERVLDLEDWQVFYVDSTLMHDFPAMQAELKELADSKVSNRDMYISVQDKWMDQIDATYKRIFTEEQWAAYLKQGAAKAQKARAKRKVKN